MSKTKQKVEESVPVLDKGNYNNKKNLLYFMEQEKIARKMIEEARSFYDNFLKSKTTTFEEILKYPNVPFIVPDIKLYYRKAALIKGKYGVHPEYYHDKNDKLAVTVSFEINLGTCSYSSFSDNFWNILMEAYRGINYWGGEKKYIKENFKNANVFKDTKNRYEVFCDKLNNYDYSEPDEQGRQYSLGDHYVCDITVKDLIDNKIYSPSRSDEDYLYDSFFQQRHHGEWRCGSPQYSYVGIDSRFTEGYDEVVGTFNEVYSEGCIDLYKIPVIKEYVDSMLKPLSDEYRDLLIQIIANVKQHKRSDDNKLVNPGWLDNILKSEFLFKKDGSIIQLLTNEIDSSTFDTKKGLYIIKCKDLVHRAAKYRWPSDAPTIKTTYYQQFTFDIASNDLVDYEFKSFREEITNNRW